MCSPNYEVFVLFLFATKRDYKMSNQSIWQVQKTDGAESLVSIIEFLLPEYIRIFGRDVMTAAPCVVYNDPSSECPLFSHTLPLRIRLAQLSLDYWAQTIYQLSHEMCHYAMHQTKQDKEQTLSWLEEIVCEAMSLYALHYAAENWHKCKLAVKDPGFDNCIRRYLDKELKCVASDGFARCNTIEKLQFYESEANPENDRASHLTERNRIYQAIVKEPTELLCVLHYQNYIQPENGVAIDFASWYEAEPKNLILQLFRIFPIKGEEKQYA